MVYVFKVAVAGNLDVTSMTNIGNGDSRLWVHLISTWVISLYLWKVSKVMPIDCLQVKSKNLLISELESLHHLLPPWPPVCLSRIILLRSP